MCIKKGEINSPTLKYINIKMKHLKKEMTNKSKARPSST